MILTLFMFLPFIATFTLATWDAPTTETRSKDLQRRNGSLCQG